LDAALARGDLGVLAPGAGPQIVRWWRSQDRFPATPANERLAEHLGRVAVSLDAFAADDPRGYDDRGEVYVRLGVPDRRTEVELSNALRAFDLRGRSPVGRLPANAYWLYDRLDAPAQFLFVRDSRRGPYRLAGGLDLIPPSLRRAGLGMRGDAEAEALLAVMEDVYSQLAVRHPVYGPAFDAVASALGPTRGPGQNAPRAARQAVALAQTTDAQADGERRDGVPAAVSTLDRDLEALPAAARWARWLDADGATHVDVIWGVEAGAAWPSGRLAQRLDDQGVEPADTVLLSASAVVLTDDFESRGADHDHRTLPEAAGATGMLTVRLGEAPRRLALQWQSRWAPRGERLRTSTLRPEAALPPLQAGVLEMSDLTPLAGVRLDGTQAEVYPFEALPPDGRLALSFEVYGLDVDADGRSSYTVEYRIAGAQGGPETSAGITYDGGATATEVVALDVTPWLGQAVEIEVRVRDEQAGTEVARTVAFSGAR
ncbi:MAG: GWxTD domain-containing protein, partial [Bacteroidota bacterium]